MAGVSRNRNNLYINCKERIHVIFAKFGKTLKVCLHVRSPCPSASPSPLPSKFKIVSMVTVRLMGRTHSVCKTVRFHSQNVNLTETETVRVNRP